jgi:tetratricopeptide (TPR) repeat protein
MKFNTLTYHPSDTLHHKMKQFLLFCLVLVSAVSFAQDKDEEAKRQLQKANNYVYEGNTLIEEEDFVSAEMEYRKAISEQRTNTAGAYNLGNSYYQKGQFDEALFRHTQAAKNATSKAEKHKAYHNIGNILMQNKLCKEAVEAFKDALRNNPSDDETRYNFAIAKECAEQQEDQQDENDKQEQEEEKEGDDEEKDKGENEEKEDENDQQDENNEDKKDGDDQKDDQGKPEDEKDEKDGKEGENKDQKGQPQPKQGQLSPQQIKNLLEAMNNQEQKVQDKINAEKQKGQKVKTEKDW